MTKPMSPCAYCGGVKEPGRRGARFCLVCTEARWKCDNCGAPKTKPNRKLCDPCLLEGQRKRADNRYMKATSVRNKEAPPGKRWCCVCEEYKPIKDFGKRKGQPIGYCRPCYSVYYMSHRLIKVYGLTAEDYFEIKKFQGDECAICGAKPRRKRMSVDHDHKTGRVRGLLCNPCNSLLGRIRDRKEILQKAIDYLENPPAAQLGLDKIPNKEVDIDHTVQRSEGEPGVLQ